MMRKFFRFVMMAMVLLVVACMSALTAMRVAIHGRETVVPNFMKLSSAEAERAAVQAGLGITLEGQFYSPDIPEGRIVSQIPSPGTPVRRGWRVLLAQSLGPQRVAIPDLTGESPRAASLNAHERGLEIDTVAQAELGNVPADQIIAQTPPPNATEVNSPKISVLVAVPPAAPQYVMPNFVGHPLADATARIAQAGFKLSVHSAAAQPPRADMLMPPAEIVISQSPIAGQKISPDTPIQLVVSQ